MIQPAHLGCLYQNLATHKPPSQSPQPNQPDLNPCTPTDLNPSQREREGKKTTTASPISTTASPISTPAKTYPSHNNVVPKMTTTNSKEADPPPPAYEVNPRTQRGRREALERRKKERRPNREKKRERESTFY